jgi:PAS domain S-box-containing protein
MTEKKADKLINNKERLDRELEDSEELFRRLAENARDMIYRMSLPDGKYEYISPASLGMWGYPPEEVYNNPMLIAKSIHPDWKDYFEKEWEKLIEGKVEPFYEYQVIHKSGKVKWFHQRNVLVRNGEGTPVAIEGIATDITDRKESEKVLRENMEKYHTLYEGANDAIFILDSRKFYDCNSETLKMFGYSHRDEIISSTLWDFSPEIQPDGEYSQVKSRRLIENSMKGIPQRFYWKHSKKDGTLFDCEVSLNRLTLAGKHYVQAIVRDITPHKKALDELCRLRNLLDNIFNSIPSLIIGIDINLRVTKCNQAAKAFTGLTEEQAIGKLMIDVLPLMADYLEHVRNTIRERKPNEGLRIVHTRENVKKHYDVAIFPLVANSVEGAVIRVDDVSEKIQIAEMMMQTEKMSSVGGLAAGMAHEINNPLAGILQNCQVILNRLLPDLPKNCRAAENSGTSIEAIRTYMEERGILNMLDMIMDAGRRAAHIVSNMLSFSSRSRGRFETCQLQRLLENALEMASNDYDLKKKYDFRGIRVRKEFETDLPPIFCEPGQLKHVFLNLLKNAAFAMDEGIKGIKKRGEEIPPEKLPLFVFRIKKDNDTVRVEIEDNGPGMEESVRRRVFEPFFTTKNVGEGTGLGLSVSYFIITENHKGTFEVDSTPGKGTRFIIKLPMQEGERD